MNLVLKKYIKRLVNEALLEVSYTEPDIPKYFWLVTSLDKYNEDFAEQLSKGVLSGVSGISGNKMIIPHFLGIGRNAILAMSGKDVVKQNKLSRIMYDNPQYLLSKDMSALYRIWSKDPKNSWGRRGVMENIMDYMKQVTKPWNIREPLGYLMNNYYGGYWRPAEEYSKSDVKINNLNDLAKFIHSSAMRFNDEIASKLSPSDFVPPLLGVFERLVKIYKSEGEWIVKDNTLQIPSNSRLLIGVPKHPKNFTKEQMELIQSDKKIMEMEWDDAQAMKSLRETLEIIQRYNLSKKYQVNWIDMKKFRQIQSKLLEKERYE